MNIDFETIIKRIKGLKGLPDDQDIARLLGLTKGAFSERKRRNSVPKKELELFCEREYINMHWVLTGEGPMRRVATEVRDRPGVPYSAEFVCIGPEGMRDDMPFDQTFILIKHVTGKISAGEGAVPDESVKAKVAFRRDWVAGKGDHANMSMISVKGDSMEPTLYNGDVVLVDHGKNFVEPQGGLYAISVDDSIMIKRLEVLPEAGKLRIISDNAKYGPREVDAAAVIINGKVIWFGRELER